MKGGGGELEILDFLFIKINLDSLIHFKSVFLLHHVNDC